MMHDKQYTSRSDNNQVGSIKREGWDNLGIFILKSILEKQQKM
jgi:hypothetical protein